MIDEKIEFFNEKFQMIPWNLPKVYGKRARGIVRLNASTVGHSPHGKDNVYTGSLLSYNYSGIILT